VGAGGVVVGDVVDGEVVVGAVVVGGVVGTGAATKEKRAVASRPRPVSFAETTWVPGEAPLGTVSFTENVPESSTVTTPGNPDPSHLTLTLRPGSKPDPVTTKLDPGVPSPGVKERPAAAAPGAFAIIATSTMAKKPNFHFAQIRLSAIRPPLPL
jgi:hypothetical protein